MYIQYFLLQLQVGEALSAANHIIGALSPGTWYELMIEARSDAGAERVILLADTHTLSGGKHIFYVLREGLCPLRNLQSQSQKLEMTLYTDDTFIICKIFLNYK